jgi:hypothetical protein
MSTRKQKSNKLTMNIVDIYELLFLTVVKFSNKSKPSTVTRLSSEEERV